MKSANRNGCVYPQEVTLEIQLKHMNETVVPSLWKIVKIIAVIFKAPRLYTQEEKTKRGGYYL